MTQVNVMLYIGYHQFNTWLEFRLSVCNFNKSYRINACETYRKMIVKRARNINSHELRGACDFNLHALKKLAEGRLRALADNLKWNIYLAYLKSDQNINLKNSVIKS